MIAPIPLGRGLEYPLLAEFFLVLTLYESVFIPQVLGRMVVVESGSFGESPGGLEVIGFQPPLFFIGEVTVKSGFSTECLYVCILPFLT